LDYLLRFAAGGLMVSEFAMLGDVLRPKSSAGLFGATPSVALATLSLALWKHGPDYISVEGRSMVLGALAPTIYCIVVSQLLMRVRCSAMAATTSATVLWLVVALGLKQLLMG
jgi:hypothetical protein